MGSLRDSGQGAEVAAKTLFTAASAVNAIPVFGQFASAGLAIAGLFTKIFGGRKRRKREAEKRKRDELSMAAKSKQQGFSKGAGAGGAQVGGGVNMGQGLGANAPVTAPQSASFNYNGGGATSTVQPTQQVISNSVFTSNS